MLIVEDSKATNIKWSASLWVPESIETMPALLPYGESVTIGIPLERGTHAPRARDLTDREKGEVNKRISPYNSPPPMFMIGYIIYKDSLDRNLITAFMREYDVTGKRFKRTNDPDHEYQD